MRNPFKRQSHFTEKPTLQDRAAALKISMARLIRGPHRVDLTDQPSSASLPQGSVEDLSSTTFIDQQLTRHDVGRGDPDITDCTAAADGHTPHLESAVGRHESFDPNTAIPMSLGVIGTVLPKAEPACAEAGIAAMLSKPEPEFVRVSQAALIEALSGDVSAAVRVAIEDHAHALKAGEDEPDHSDEAFERHSARQNETDERLRSVRCQTLSDLRAKLTYLIPVSRPDLLDQRVGDHLEGLLADIDALSRVQAEPPFVLPAQMPAPGSPEAMALHKAACIEFDRRTHLTDAEYARLKIGDTHTLWTIDTVREVMEGDYSSLMGNEAYAANEKTHAELQELLILTKRREQQFEDAQRDLKLHEVHALAFPDDHEEAGGVGCEDPIHAAIREHKAAYAAWLPHLRATNETLLSNPIYSDLEAAAEAPGDREKEAFDALSEVLPTTREGLLALASYLPGAVLRNSCTNADSDAVHALGAMCDAVKELAKSGGIKSYDKGADWHHPPLGFMASPSIEPFGFIKIENGIHAEIERLLVIASTEFLRKLDVRTPGETDADRRQREADLRQRLLIPALVAAFDPDSDGAKALAALNAAAPSPSTVDPILAAIEECRRLEAISTAACAKPSGADGNCTPAQTATIKAVWQHVDGLLSETVPTTAAGCVALARFIPALFDRWGASLDGEQAGKLFRLIERSPAHQSEHSENLEADAELIEIGRQWPGLLAAYLESDRRLAAIEELDEEPQRPKELNVYSFDHLNGFPRTEDWGNRSAPYGADQIDELRAVPRVAVYLATPRGGIRREDGTLLNINEAAQRRAESIIEAWDRWQAEIAAYEAKHDLPALMAICREATAAYDAAILKARSIPAQTSAGLLVKARIAAELCPSALKEDDDALDENAILKSVLADLLKIGQPSATTLRSAEIDPAAIVAGRTAVGA